MQTQTKTILAIAKRVEAILYRLYQGGHPCDTLSIMMDIEAAILVNPMDLTRWLEGEEFDFFHDWTGIYENLNRETGEIENGFRPRYSKQQEFKL